MFESEGVIHAVQFKPIVNEIDELVGKLYGLNDEMGSIFRTITRNMAAG